MAQQAVVSLNLSQIRPPKYALRDSVGDLAELEASMKTHGLIQPIVVRPKANHYEIVAGHRRYVAALEIGWSEVAVSVIDVDDKTAFLLSLTENIERKSLDPIEEAKAFHAYTSKYGYGSVTDLAKIITRSEGYIRHTIELLKLPDELRTRVRSQELTATHGEELTRLPNQQAIELGNEVRDVGLTTDQTRIAVDYVKAGLSVDQAVKRVIDFPDLAPPKEHQKFDSVKVAREQIELSLHQALKSLDYNLGMLVDAVEKKTWIRDVRYPLHELLNVAIHTRKEFDKK